MGKTKIGVDLDGVVYNFISLFTYTVNYHKRRLSKPLIEEDDIKEYSLFPSFAIGEEEFKATLDTMKTSRWARYIGIFSDARPALEQLRDDDNKVILVTARADCSNFGYDKIRKDTIQRLNSDGIEYDDIYFTSDKAGLAKAKGIELFVEDSGQNACDITRIADIPVVLMDNIRNRNMMKNKKMHTAKDWSEAVKLIKKLKGGLHEEKTSK